MTAATTTAPAARYDTSCAFCVDGIPACRVQGKACCARCSGIFSARRILPSGELPVTESMLRRLIRYELGLDPRGRDYPVPLWRRALDAREAGLA